MTIGDLLCSWTQAGLCSQSSHLHFTLSFIPTSNMIKTFEENTTTTTSTSSSALVCVILCASYTFLFYDGLSPIIGQWGERSPPLGRISNMMILFLFFYENADTAICFQRVYLGFILGIVIKLPQLELQGTYSKHKERVCCTQYVQTLCHSRNLDSKVTHFNAACMQK